VIFTSPLSYLVGVVLKEDSDTVAAELLAQGVLHFVKIEELDPSGAGSLLPANVDGELAVVKEARRRINALLQVSEIPAIVPAPVDTADASGLDPNSVNNELDSLVREMEVIRGRQKKVQQDINRLEEVARQLPLVSSGALQLANSGSGRFLAVRMGTLSPAGYDRLQGELGRYPAVASRIGMQDDRVTVMVASMKRHDSEILSILQGEEFGDLRERCRPDRNVRNRTSGQNRRVETATARASDPSERDNSESVADSVRSVAETESP